MTANMAILYLGHLVKLYGGDMPFPLSTTATRRVAVTRVFKGCVGRCPTQAELEKIDARFKITETTKENGNGCAGGLADRKGHQN